MDTSYSVVLKIVFLFVLGLGRLRSQHNFHSKEKAILKYYVAAELACDCLEERLSLKNE